jgi:hypothetical protein
LCCQLLQRFYTNEEGWKIFPERFLIVGKDPSKKSCNVGKERFEWTLALTGERSLCFDTKHPYTKGQLRELLIKSAKELLNQINENNEIQEFLKERSFTIKNVEIIIYNHDENGRGLCDPEISTACISQAVLIYRTIDPPTAYRSL